MISVGRRALLQEAGDALAGIGRDQLLEQWNQCHGSLAIGVVGDEVAIREALKRASF